MAFRLCERHPSNCLFFVLFVYVTKTNVDDVVCFKYLFDEFRNCSLRILLGKIVCEENRAYA